MQVDPADVHALMTVLITFLQSVNPILCAALGAWAMHIGHTSGVVNSPPKVTEPKKEPTP
jgi:hypothetical protein